MNSSFTKFPVTYSDSIPSLTLPPSSAVECSLSVLDLLPDSENESIEKPDNHVNQTVDRSVSASEPTNMNPIVISNPQNQPILRNNPELMASILQ